MLAFATAIALGAATTGCKRPTPPSAKRVWLGASGGCAILDTNETACWGANDEGQITGTPTPPLLTARVVSVAPKELALGRRHACAVLTDGHAGCWGGVPDAAKALRDDGDVVEVAVGGAHSCTISKTRSLRCFGDDAEGQLPSAVDLAIGAPIAAVALGEAHTCYAIGSDQDGSVTSGGVRCFGRAIAAPRGALLEGVAVRALAAGRAHTCALLHDGTVRCWGDNDSGQLGDGSFQPSSTPVVVHGIDGAARIAAGDRFTCVLHRGGMVSCWGDNRFHQLANGTTKSDPKPQMIQGIFGVRELAVGGDAACARMGDGELRCWGRNARGELGDGTTRDHDVPMAVRLPRRVGAKK